MHPFQVNARDRKPAWRACLIAWLLAGLAGWTGCSPLSLDDARRLAEVASWTGQYRVSLDEKQNWDLWNKARIVFGYGPGPSERAKLYLRRYDVEPNLRRSKLDALRQLKQLAEQEPDLQKEFTLSELAFHEASVNHEMGRREKAKLWYLTSVYHAYRFLFSPNYDDERNAYAPEFRMVVDYYNRSLENFLKILNQEEGLKSTTSQQQKIDQWTINYSIQLRGPWAADEFEKFEFANDYEVKGIGNRHRTEGLGVPLIAVRDKATNPALIDKYYPPGLALPVTAFLRFSEGSCRVGSADVHNVQCVIELHDPLRSRNVAVGHRPAPLESDITTPLAYFLQDPLVSTQVMETLGLLQVDLLADVQGLYMLEPYDPERIPVVLVHGLWSGPFTWLEMFNELRALPEIRENYQFWFYLYPTGQPFWLSAKQMRADLAELHNDIDPHHQIATLDQMVLIGHSMGGLVSRLQTVDSGDEFWRIVSDRPFEELDTDAQTKAQIRDTLFFRANPSIKRVVTIGTPHRGSSFANNFTRWLGHKLIQLPDLLDGSVVNKIRNRDAMFKNKEVLSTKTSIDSLSSESPFLERLLEARSAPWVTAHNIVGNVQRRKYLGIAGELTPTAGDGIVSTDSSVFERAVSQLEVDAKHQEIHLQPKTILEVRRILLIHADEARREFASQPPAPGNRPASFDSRESASDNGSPGIRFPISDLPAADSPKYDVPFPAISGPVPQSAVREGEVEKAIRQIQSSHDIPVPKVP